MTPSNDRFPLEGPDFSPSLGDGAEIELKEKGSRFLAQVFAVATEADAQTRLEQPRRRYHDASHHCWALRLRPVGAPHERAEDDGEPSGSAGVPILGSLQRENVYDCLVVVTRYFGGTKLGRGGLVRAYGEAARRAVEIAPARTLWHDARLRVGCSYDDLGAVEACLARKREIIRRVDREFAEKPRLEIVLLRSAAQLLADELVEVTAGRASVGIGEA